MIKKIAIGLGSLIALLLLAALLVPVLFKGKITDAVKKGINNQINATVNFSDVSISIFKHFPTLTLRLSDLSVANTAPFEGDTLVALQHLDVSLNIMSVISGDKMEINAIDIYNPHIYAHVLKNGNANWNITKPSDAQTTTDTSKPFAMQLKRYAIHNGFIKYKDEQGNMYAQIDGLNHSGKGNFASETFTLATTTNIDSLTYEFGGVPYLKKVKTQAGFDLQVDNAAKTYKFETDNIVLNELKLSTGGTFSFVNDTTYGLDISFKAPNTQFKNILSFIPAIYQNNFADIKTDGSLQLDGFVKGNYSSTQIPAFHVGLKVQDGYFKYPDLPEAVKNIQIALTADNKDGIPDNTVVDISKAHFEMAAEPFDLKMLIKNPVSNLFVDLAAKGKLDLAKVSQFVKMPDVTKLSGLLNANAEVVANMNDINAKQYQKIKASGEVSLANFQFASKTYPQGLSLTNLLLTFNPQNVTLSNCVGQFDNTHFTATGYLNNLIPYALKNQPLEGVLNVKADYIDVNKMMGLVPADTTQKAAAATAPFAIPANLKLTVNAASDKVIYDKYQIQSLAGTLNVADEKVSLANVKGNVFDGQMVVNGYYDTKNNKKNPDISFNYDVKNIDVQKSFASVITMQKLLPVTQFINGKINSQFTLKGNLGQNMMPDFATLFGNGNLSIAQGVISKFTPISKVAQSLSISQLTQDFPLKDLKGVFQFANGKLLINPFKIKAAGIDMEIGGTNGYDKSIDYTINMKVPRALMGEKGNSLINNFTAQAAAKGVPVKLSDVVPVQVKLGGLITNPTVKTDVKQAATSLAQDLKQQAQAFVQNKIDSTKTAVTNAVKDTIKSVKTALVNEAKNQLVNQVFNKKDSSNTNKDPKKVVEEAGKGLLKSLNPFKKGNK